jgi:hypothetical protein
MPDITKLNPFLEDGDYKINSVDFESAFIAKEREKVVDKEDEGESGSGRITLDVEQLNAYLLACFTKERRQGQKKFGPIPFTDDPNSLLGKKTRCAMGGGELPHAHPLLAQSQQFSGDDPKITAIPSDNSKARERYPELRLENQLRKNLGVGRRKSVTLSR